MSDLISRLSEIRSQYNCFDEAERPYYHALSEAIEALFARPEERTEERTETHACDCISRQAEIDEITEYGSGYVTYMSGELKRRIEQLPPAQPEIIKCKDCKHRGESPIADGRYWCEIHDTFMRYCSDAERREECL